MSQRLYQNLLRGLLVACVLSFPARAEFELCNKSDHTAVVAIGYKSSKDWVSEGWWRIKPRACRVLIAGPLRTRYVLVHAAQEGVDGDWDGAYRLCVKPKNFKIRGRQDCRKRKLGEARFFAVDTGSALTMVYNLSD
ncbi:MAG: DUF1036 domain-containing protein [Alphaproteobacteria bacterium]|jgi:uncharacterized membrane protein